jgi:hypothetical protein
MNTRLVFVSFFALAVLQIPAQVQHNEFDMYSGTTLRTSRAGLQGPNPGDIAQPFRSGLMSGLGQYLDPVTGRLVHRAHGLRVMLQDEDESTSEFFTLALIGENPTTPQTPDPSRELFRSARFMTPSSGLSRPWAWQLTVSFATPFDLLPACSTFYVACGVPANARWFQDGLSVHMSDWSANPFSDSPFPEYLVGRILIPHTSFRIDRTAGAVVVGMADRFHRLWYFGPSPTLKVGADLDPLISYFNRTPNPAFGAAGLWPDQTNRRLDGLAFRVRDQNHPNAFCIILGHAGEPQYPGILLGWPFVGAVYLNPSAPIWQFASGSLLGGNFERVVERFPNRWNLGHFGLGRMNFQAVLIDGDWIWTNAYGFHAF